MTPLTYIGPHDEVEIDTGQTCKRGASIEVSKDLAKGLLAQPSNWRKTEKDAS